MADELAGNRIPKPPIDDHHHRDIQGGAARAAVFGVSDGLVSNVGLILGVAGANTAPTVVRLAGLAGLIAGAISMAAGEYNSMRVQTELFEREIALERREIEKNPKNEALELAHKYQSRGVDSGLALEFSESLMSMPEAALEFHAREELGVIPGELGSPVTAAGWSFIAFTVGASIPLLPWFFGGGGTAKLLSIVLALLAAVAVGVGIAQLTEGSKVRSAGRQVAFTAVPAAITYAIGSLIGASI